MTYLCTVVVVTRHRSAFVARLLDHMALAGLTMPMIIGDGSDFDRAHETRTITEGRIWPFPLEYRHYGPETALWQRVGLIADTVETPYFAWVADDDFLVPEALQEAISVLESDPGLVGVSGSDGGFNIVGNTVRGMLSNCWFEGVPCRDEASPVLRTLNHFRSYYPCAYAIRRTTLVQRNTRLFRAAGWNDDYSNNFCEIADGVLSAASGRLALLPRALYFRQQHEASESQVLRAKWSPFDMVTDLRWPGIIRNFERWLTERISESSAADQELILRAIRAGLWDYYSKYLSSGIAAEEAMVVQMLSNQSEITRKGWLLSWLKEIPMLRRLFSSWRIRRGTRNLSDTDKRAFNRIRIIVESSQFG